jgi:hypothetical protein
LRKRIDRLEGGGRARPCPECGWRPDEIPKKIEVVWNELSPEEIAELETEHQRMRAAASEWTRSKHSEGDAGGKAVNLSLHPRCALHFRLQFMRDVHDLDLDESLSFGVGEGRSGRLALALWADEYLPAKAAPAAVGVALYELEHHAA